MKTIIIGLILGLVFSFAGIVSLNAKPAEATFDICNILPWLPQCQEEEPEVTICHRTENDWEEITINENALDAHLEHGDFTVDEGSPCPPEEEEEPTPTPTPEVTPTPIPTSPPSTTEASQATTPEPVCPGGNTANLPISPQIKRQNGDAIAQWWPTGSDLANIYWRLVGSTNWEHSLPQVDNDGYEDNIHGLSDRDWVFGIQQGCGPIAVIVDGNESEWTLFKLSFWE